VNAHYDIMQNLKKKFPSLNEDKYHWEWNPFTHTTTDLNFTLEGGGGEEGRGDEDDGIHRMMTYYVELLYIPPIQHYYISCRSKLTFM